MLIASLFSLFLNYVQSDKRKGALLEKDPSKKARLEPDEIVFEAPNSEEKGVESLGESCSVCNSAVSTSKVSVSESTVDYHPAQLAFTACLIV